MKPVRIGVRFISWVAFAISAGSAVSANTVIFAQDDAYAPYMTSENGAPSGILSDIVNEAAERAGLAIDLQALPWGRAVNKVKEGTMHALVGTYFRPKNRPWIATYSEPLLIEYVSVFCRPGVAGSDWSYPDDFKGLHFLNNIGFRTPGEAFFALVDAGEIDLEEVRTTKNALQRIAAGRADCYVQENLNVQTVINELELDGIEQVGVASAEPSHVGFTETWTGPEASAFIDAFNAALVEMHGDGTVDQIIDAAITK